MRHQRGRQWLWEVEALQHLGAVRAESQGAAAAAAAAGRCRQTWGWDHSSYIVLDQWYLTTDHVSLGNVLKRCVFIGLPSACGVNPESRNVPTCRLHLTFSRRKCLGKKTKTSLAYCMGKRKKITIAYLPTIADWLLMMIEIVEQTNMSRKKGGKKKTGESHACGQTREKVCFESDFFFVFPFNLISRLLERRRLLLGGRHYFTCLPTSQMWIHQRCLPRDLLYKALRVMILCNRTRQRRPQRLRSTELVLGRS